jgi:hypothetical protein
MLGCIAMGQVFRKYLVFANMLGAQKAPIKTMRYDVV